jgi:hypothetical protein
MIIGVRFSQFFLHVSAIYVMVRLHIKISLLGCLEVAQKFVWWVVVVGVGVCGGG